MNQLKIKLLKGKLECFVFNLIFVIFKEKKNIFSSKPLSTVPPKPAVVEQNNKNNESSSSSKPDAKPTQTNQQPALPQIQIFPIPGQQAPSLSSSVQQLLIAIIRPTFANKNNSQIGNNENKNPNNFYPGPNEMGQFFPPDMFHSQQGMMSHPGQELPPFFGPEHPFPFGPEPAFHQLPHTEATHEFLEITLPQSHPPPYQPSHPFDGPHPSSVGSSQTGPFHSMGSYQAPGQFYPTGPHQAPNQFYPPGQYQAPGPFNPTQLDPSSLLYLPALVVPQQSAFGPQSFQTQKPILMYFPATVANNQSPYFSQSFPPVWPGSFPSMPFAGGAAGGAAPAPLHPQAYQSLVG